MPAGNTKIAIGTPPGVDIRSTNTHSTFRPLSQFHCFHLICQSSKHTNSSSPVHVYRRHQVTKKIWGSIRYAGSLFLIPLQKVQGEGHPPPFSAQWRSGRLSCILLWNKQELHFAGPDVSEMFQPSTFRLFHVYDIFPDSTAEQPQRYKKPVWPRHGECKNVINIDSTAANFICRNYYSYYLNNGTDLEKNSAYFWWNKSKFKNFNLMKTNSHSFF